MSYLPCKEPCFVGKLGNWIQVWLPQIMQQCAHVLESRKIQKYREIWTLHVLSANKTGWFLCFAWECCLSFMFHMLYTGCVYMVWHIDSVIVMSIHSFLCQYHGQGGFPDAMIAAGGSQTKAMVHNHKSTKWPNLVPRWSVTVTNTAVSKSTIWEIRIMFQSKKPTNVSWVLRIHSFEDSWIGSKQLARKKWPSPTHGIQNIPIPETNQNVAALRWYLKEILSSIGPPNASHQSLCGESVPPNWQKTYVSKDHLIITYENLGCLPRWRLCNAGGF